MGHSFPAFQNLRRGNRNQAMLKKVRDCVTWTLQTLRPLDHLPKPLARTPYRVPFEVVYSFHPNQGKPQSRCVGGLRRWQSLPTAALSGSSEGTPCRRHAPDPSAPAPALRLHAQARKQLRILHLLCRILHHPPRQPSAPVSDAPRCTRATPSMLPTTPSATAATEVPLDPGILPNSACWILHPEPPDTITAVMEHHLGFI